MNPVFIQIALSPLEDVPDSTRIALAAFLRKNNMQIKKIKCNTLVVKNNSITAKIKVNREGFEVVSICVHQHRYFSGKTSTVSTSGKQSPKS